MNAHLLVFKSGVPVPPPRPELTTPVNDPKTGRIIPFDAEEADEPELTFVINLQDGSGQEFYVDQSHALVSLKDGGERRPLPVQTYALLAQLRQVRQQYPANCQVYALSLPEFKQRQNGFLNAA